MRLVRRDYDPELGITEEFWFQEGLNGEKGKITIRRLQDVEGVLDLNGDEFNQHDGIHYNDSNGVHRVARIPFVRIEQWMREGFNWFTATDAERRAKLNDRDNRKLLVRPGKL